MKYDYFETITPFLRFLLYFETLTKLPLLHGIISGHPLHLTPLKVVNVGLVHTPGGINIQSIWGQATAKIMIIIT